MAGDSLRVEQLRPGLWRWEVPHPEWAPEDLEGGEGWDEVVASYAVETPGAFLLVDPLAPAEGSDDAEHFWAALDRDVERSGPPSVLLTIFFHTRSSREILERYPGASVWVHEPAAELVAERATYTDTFTLGDELPGAATAYNAGRAFEVVYWLPSHGALFAGDVLLGASEGGARICPESWTRNKTRAELREALLPLLELPVELLLLTHGAVGARDVLERALAP